jgi:hypothetical protein
MVVNRICFSSASMRTAIRIIPSGPKPAGASWWAGSKSWLHGQWLCARDMSALSAKMHVQKTTRLHDLFRANNYVVQYKDKFQEAELVTESLQADTGPLFPSEVDFESISSLMGVVGYAGQLYIKQNDEVGADHPATGGQTLPIPAADTAGASDHAISKVEVLWLSPTEFISSLDIIRTDGEYTNMWHYSLRFVPPDTASDRLWPRRMHAYSTSLFTTDCWDAIPAPSIHLHFLRHIIKPLPVNFWVEIELDEGKTYLSPQLCTLFLSVIPKTSVPSSEFTTAEPTLGSDANRSTVYSKTTLWLVMKIDKDKMEAIASQELNPHVRLAFGKFRVPPPTPVRGINILPWEKIDKDTLPMHLLNELLRESKHIRHFCIPLDLVAFESNDSVSFAMNPNFESLSMDGVFQGNISSQLMKGIALNPSIKSLYVDFRLVGRFPSNGPEWESLTNLFTDVVAGHPSLSTLVLKFNDRDESWNSWPRSLLHDVISTCIAEALAGATKEPKLGSLKSLKLIYEYFRNGEEEFRPSAPLYNQVRHLLS